MYKYVLVKDGVVSVYTTQDLVKYVGVLADALGLGIPRLERS